MAKKPYKFKKQHLYYVEWIDAFTTEDRWMSKEDLLSQSSNPFICKTVGWCINLTKDSVCLTQTWGSTEDSAEMYSNSFVIPLGWIKTIKKLS